MEVTATSPGSEMRRVNLNSPGAATALQPLKNFNALMAVQGDLAESTSVQVWGLFLTIMKSQETVPQFPCLQSKRCAAALQHNLRPVAWMHRTKDTTVTLHACSWDAHI